MMMTVLYKLRFYSHLSGKFPWRNGHALSQLTWKVLRSTKVQQFYQEVRLEEFHLTPSTP